MTTEDKKTTAEVVENNDTPKDTVKETKVEEIPVEKTEASTEEKKEVKTEEKSEVKVEEKTETKTERPERKPFSRNGGKPFKKNFKKRPFKREKPEFEQKILSLRRVTRVMAGGRRFSFSVAMVIGDKKNRVGLGMGKANDVVSAIEKAGRNAKKNMLKIKLTDNGSVPYDLDAKFNSSRIIIRPITGKGLAAGGAVRSVLEFAGVKEAGAKILSRSKNHINNAKATFIALAPIAERYIYEEPKRNLMDRRGGRGGFNRNGKPGQGGQRRPFNPGQRRPFNGNSAQKTEAKVEVKKD
ncbi:MAG TPA: hypothetical protein EYG89_01555 [Bacteroidia bacterium]|nr:hypothetical protein [Bacteroidia bacterium]